MEEELNALSVSYAGELQARGFDNTAALDRLRRQSAKTEGYVSAAGTLLRGGADYYETDYLLKSSKE